MTKLMTKRSTVNVEELMEMANNFLLNSADNETGERKGVASFIESVLMRANRYAGFRYLNGTDMKGSFNGKTPGIEWEMADGSRPSPEDKPRFLDHTRRRYSITTKK